MNSLPACPSQNRKTSPIRLFHVSSDKGLLSSTVPWLCVLLLECQLEGQAEVASWWRSTYSKTGQFLSCDTGVRNKMGTLPAIEAVTYFYSTRSGFSLLSGGRILTSSRVLNEPLPPAEPFCLFLNLKQVTLS